MMKFAILAVLLLASVAGAQQIKTTTTSQKIYWNPSASQSSTSCLTCVPPTGPTLTNIYTIVNPTGGVCPSWTGATWNEIYTGWSATGPYTLTGLPYASTICVCITAYFLQSGPKAESGPSNILTFQTPPAPTIGVPLAPTGLTVSN